MFKFRILFTLFNFIYAISCHNLAFAEGSGNKLDDVIAALDKSITILTVKTESQVFRNNSTKSKTQSALTVAGQKEEAKSFEALIDTLFADTRVSKSVPGHYPTTNLSPVEIAFLNHLLFKNDGMLTISSEKGSSDRYKARIKFVFARLSLLQNKSCYNIGADFAEAFANAFPKSKEHLAEDNRCMLSFAFFIAGYGAGMDTVSNVTGCPIQ